MGKRSKRVRSRTDYAGPTPARITGPIAWCAHLLEGIQFPYTPVQAAEVWGSARGYGFNRAALLDEDRTWDRSKLDGDGCRMNDSVKFQFSVEPGTYHLAVGFSPFEEEGTLRIEGLPEPLTLPVSKREALALADLVVTHSVVLSVPHAGYGEIRWLSLLENE